RRSPVGVRVVGTGPEHDAGATDRDRVAVHECRGRDLVTLDEHAVGRAEVGRDDAVGRDPDLEVASGDAGVVDDDVGLAAAPDHGHGTGEQVALAVDVEQGVACTGRGGGCDGAAHGLAAQPEAARGEVLGLGEGHGDGPHEGVVLAGRVLCDVRGELVGEGFGAPLLDVLEV